MLCDTKLFAECKPILLSGGGLIDSVAQNHMLKTAAVGRTSARKTTARRVENWGEGTCADWFKSDTPNDAWRRTAPMPSRREFRARGRRYWAD
jgi:hypothetical protein